MVLAIKLIQIILDDVQKELKLLVFKLFCHMDQPRNNLKFQTLNDTVDAQTHAAQVTLISYFILALSGFAGALEHNISLIRWLS